MKQLPQMIESRNKMFGQFMPAQGLNINLTLQMPEVMGKTIEEQKKKKTAPLDHSRFAKLLADKIREEPIYTKSNHPGGG